MGYSDYDALSSYYRTSNYPSTISAFDNIATVLMGFSLLIIVGILAILVLQIVANWKLFVKAGEKGWKSIIPFYGTAILYKISGMSPWLVLLYLGFFIPVINFFVAIAFAVLSLYQPINLAKGFKKSTGFTVGLIMVPFVFRLILGLGKSQYYGFDETKTAEETTVEETKAE